MPTLVTLLLRTDAKHVTDDGPVTWTYAKPDEVDLDELTPRARALAEAVAQLPGGRKGAGEILCEHRTLTRRETTLTPERWLSSEQMDQPARQRWSAWDTYTATAETGAVEYLERQARKIPPEWAIVSAWTMVGAPSERVASAAAGAADDLLLVRGVVEHLARHHDRRIGVGTWRSYVARSQAPAAAGRVGRVGLWSPRDVDAWARGEWRADG